MKIAPAMVGSGVPAGAVDLASAERPEFELGPL